MSRWFWGGLVIAFALGWLLGREAWSWAMVVAAAALLVCGRVLYHLIQQAQLTRSTLETERNRLSSLIAELSEGVLLCEATGVILLHNPQAQQLLSLPASFAEPVSVYTLLDEKALRHGLERLAHQQAGSEGKRTTQLRVAAAGGQTLKARIIPLHGPRHNNGFIVLLTNITQQDQASRQRDELLRLLTEGVRASLANIRAAIETIEMFSDMDAEKLAQLRHVIYEESLTLSTRLNQITRDHETVLKANWHLEEMSATDLLWMTKQHLSERMGLTVHTEEPEGELWLKIDSYAIVQAMGYLSQQIRKQWPDTPLTLRLKRMGRLGALDLLWPGNNLETETLWSWQREPFPGESGEQSFTLEELAERHGGEVWCQVDSTTTTAYFRLLLPLITDKDPIR